MTKNTLSALQSAAQVIYDKKGFNIMAVDVHEFSTMTDYFLVAEGSVERHVASLASNLLDFLREKGVDPLHVEGQKTGDWVVLDYGDFVIHLMETEMREKYRLEEIWKQGKIVDLKIKITDKV